VGFVLLANACARVIIDVAVGSAIIGFDSLGEIAVVEGYQAYISFGVSYHVSGSIILIMITRTAIGVTEAVRSWIIRITQVFIRFITISIIHFRLIHNLI
jgi:hypothetical protein